MAFFKLVSYILISAIIPCSVLNAGSFLSYCEDAEKSKAEQHTIKMLGEYAQSEDCKDIESMLQGSAMYDFSDPKLSDLKALTFFPNIETLYLVSQEPMMLSQLDKMENLSHIRVDAPLMVISSLPKRIRYLWVFNAPVLKIASLSRYTELEELNIYDSKLESFDFLEGAASLKYLGAISTGLTSLDQIPTLPTLGGFDLSGNAITSLAGLSRFESLLDLYVSLNQISDISEIKSLPLLEAIAISHTKVQDLTPLADMPNLAYVTLDGLNLKELPDLGAKKDLVRLSIRENNLTDISRLKAYPSLRGLAVGYNKLSEIGVVAHLPRLKRLWAQHNVLKAMPKFPESIFQVNIEYNLLTGLDHLIEQSLPTLKYVDFSHNAVTDLTPLGHLNSLRSLNLNNNAVQTLNGLEKLSNLFELKADDNKISDITALAKNVQTLDVYLNGNLITDLSVLAAKEQLRYFEMANNPLGTTIAKTEENCPTKKGPSLLNEWCSQKTQSSFQQVTKISSVQTQRELLGRTAR